MKILDEIRVYNGKLDYCELNELVKRINNRVNMQVNQGTGCIPLMYFHKKKAFLRSLLADTIRKHYQIINHTAKVNHSSMFLLKLENRLEARLRHFCHYRLLIIDEVGYLSIDKEDFNLFSG